MEVLEEFVGFVYVVFLGNGGELFFGNMLLSFVIASLDKTLF